MNFDFDTLRKLAQAAVPDISDQLENIESEGGRLVGIMLMIGSSAVATLLAALAPFWAKWQERKAEQARIDINEIYSLMQSNRARRKRYRQGHKVTKDHLENALTLLNLIEEELPDIRGLRRAIVDVRLAYEATLKTEADVIELERAAEEEISAYKSPPDR
jgi:hypothetical protein